MPLRSVPTWASCDGDFAFRIDTDNTYSDPDYIKKEMDLILYLDGFALKSMTVNHMTVAVTIDGNYLTKVGQEYEAVDIAANTEGTIPITVYIPGFIPTG